MVHNRPALWRLPGRLRDQRRYRGETTVLWQFDFVATHIKLTKQGGAYPRYSSFDLVRKRDPGFEAAAALRAMPNMTSVAFTKVF